MLFLVFRKIYSNKWLMLSLLLGMVLTVAMVCSIPLYTDGILQRMLIKDMENYQLESGQYPGKYEVELNISQYYTPEKGQQISRYNYFANIIQDGFLNDIGIDTVAQRREVKINDLRVVPEELYGNADARVISSQLVGLEGLPNHITLISGSLPNPEAQNGVIECVIFPQSQQSNNIMLGKTYVLEGSNEYGDIIRVKPVGVIKPESETDQWWANIDQYYFVFFADYDYMQSYFLYGHESITRVKWLYQFDYTKIRINKLDDLIDTINAQEEWFRQHGGVWMYYKSLPVLEQYLVRADQLRMTLWILQAPTIIMLAFYIFMVAQLVIENDGNEISILKSRGSSRGQILMVYLLQSSVLALTACVTGPLLGMLICKVLGAANGFMEFVSRSSLHIRMSTNAILYSIAAGVFSIAVMMIPALKASKISIVELKQKKSRKWNAPWWQKIFLDFIFLGLSIYGLNDYLRQGKTRLVVQESGLTAPVDPFIFIILTLFILGAGLLFLRIYPLIIKLIYNLGKKAWPPVVYSSLIQVSRTSGREQFLILFLVLTISVGIFGANSTRTINQNIEDRVKYDIGCDMKLQAVWQSNEALIRQIEDISISNVPLIYIEPPFSTMQNIQGTLYAAKVLRTNNITVKAGDKTDKGELMAINPYDFGMVAWKSAALLPHHINEYLNLMSYSQNAVIVSEAYRTEFSLKTGDTISYTWAGQEAIEGVIVAFAGYWPGINPNKSEESKFFIVANLDYIQIRTATEPYEVWFKNTDNASTKDIYDYIENNNIDLKWIQVAKQELIKQKNNPMLQGINGAMTLNFTVTMMISMTGFIIYWILSIKARTLQFGIFRAMGMTKRNVLSMIAIEQVLISLAAVVMGIIIGGISCRLFMPLLQAVGSAAEQVPPYRLVASMQDYIKLYAMIFVMIVGGFTFIGWMVSKIKIAQVIKLGED